MKRRRIGMWVGIALWLGSPFGAAAQRSSGMAVSPKQPGSEGVAAVRAAAAVVTSAAEAAAPAVAAPPPTPAPAAEPPLPSGPKKKGAKGQSGDGKGGVIPGGGDKPLSIRSDELEAVEEPDHSRRLMFQRDVHVEQGDLVVNSEHLEAHYPANTNQPDKLHATGRVRIVQKDRVLTCDNATYYQADERLVCVGDAVLTRGNDRVRGDQIEIFTSQNRVLVHGRATVNVTPESKAEPKPEPKKAEATP
jgi:lipopolysaccharide transport protein LptA